MNRPYEIVTEPGNGCGPNDWTVRGIWHGARRVLYRGSIFECCHWVRMLEEEVG